MKEFGEKPGKDWASTLSQEIFWKNWCTFCQSGLKDCPQTQKSDRNVLSKLSAQIFLLHGRPLQLEGKRQLLSWKKYFIWWSWNILRFNFKTVTTSKILKTHKLKFSITICKHLKLKIPFESLPVESDVQFNILVLKKELSTKFGEIFKNLLDENYFELLLANSCWHCHSKLWFSSRWPPIPSSFCIILIPARFLPGRNSYSNFLCWPNSYCIKKSRRSVICT